MVGAFADKEAALHAIDERGVDFVITAEVDESAGFTDLISGHPDLRVLAVSPDGDSTLFELRGSRARTLALGPLSPAELIALIKSVE